MTSAASSNDASQQGLIGKWIAIPLYWRILASMVLGLILGLVLGENAEIFRPFSQVILQLLGALAPPLILIAVVHVLMTSNIPKGSVLSLIHI